MVDIIGNRRSLFILYYKEYIKFTKVVLHIIDLFVIAVRCRRYIDKINLHPLKEAQYNNRFKRAFGLTIGLTIIDLTQLNKEIDLRGRDTIVLVIDLGSSSILTSIA